MFITGSGFILLVSEERTRGILDMENTELLQLL